MGQVAPQMAVAMPNRAATYRSQRLHAQVHAQLARSRNVSVSGVPLGRVMNHDSLLGISVPKCILHRSIKIFLFALRGRPAAIASQSWIPSFPIGWCAAQQERHRLRNALAAAASHPTMWRSATARRSTLEGVVELCHRVQDSKFRKQHGSFMWPASVWLGRTG